ncbi:hypothetical protein [Lentilitoribacter sp. EG35]|uniref:hypothetical protein n=1 Tax=Lentilitoribacter sp. EG35 TaxID=3234192 RepID=UPI00345F6C3A
MQKNYILQELLDAKSRAKRADVLVNMTPHFIGLYRPIIETCLRKNGDEDFIVFLQVHSAFMRATGQKLDDAYEARKRAVVQIRSTVMTGLS